MTSREAMAYRVAAISRELYRAVIRMQGSIGAGTFDQLEKSTLSIGSNWCEACGREGTPNAPLQFMRFARGSAYEAAFQLDCIGETVLSEMAHDAALLIEAEMAVKVTERVDLEAAFKLAEERSDSRFGQPVIAGRMQMKASNDVGVSTNAPADGDIGRDPESC